MKKLLLVISLLTSIYANNELGKDVIEDYDEVTYVCEDGLVIAELRVATITKEIPVVWEQNNTIVRLSCNDFEEWSK